MKRALDIILALLIALPSIPLILVFSLLIFLEDRGNPIFAQTRVGRNLEPFTLYKLRTMSIGTPMLGTHEVSAASVTRLGRFLRASKIDELPQLLNVLRGDMSFVGPRPCLYNQTELIEERKRLSVFSVVPGITGLAQVNGVDMSVPARLALWDYKYVASRTVCMDLKLLVQTFTGKGSGDRIKGDPKGTHRQ